MEIVDFFREFVSHLAVLMTILLFLSGSLVCQRYMYKRTTAESSPLPFVFGLLSSTLWFLYGLCKHDNKIILVNTVGVALYTAYIVIFYIYTFKKSSVLKQVFLTLIFIMFMLGYTYSEDDHQVLLDRLGIISSILTLMTIAAPMTKLFHVFRVKNTECLPFPMIAMSFMVSTLWGLYGAVEGDFYLLLPNFVGSTLAISQLCLFVIYPNRSTVPLTI